MAKDDSTGNLLQTKLFQFKKRIPWHSPRDYSLFCKQRDLTPCPSPEERGVGSVYY